MPEPAIGKEEALARVRELRCAVHVRPTCAVQAYVLSRCLVCRTKLRDTTVEMHGYSLQTKHMRALEVPPPALPTPPLDSLQDQLVEFNQAAQVEMQGFVAQLTTVVQSSLPSTSPRLPIKA